MLRFGQGRWWLTLYDGWDGELEDGTACIARPQGDGVVLISAADKAEGPVSRQELQALAQGECPADAAVGDCDFGTFRGIHAMYESEEDRWHRWYLSHGSLVLLVSYTVPLDLEGAEDDAVMAMLRSLKARAQAWE